LELHGDHFGIDLHYRAYQPIAHAIAISIVIAENFHSISDRVGFILAWIRGEIQSWQSCLR
jgi:hypothetical protein